MDAEIVEGLGLDGMPEGSHEQGDGLVHLDSLMIAPRLAHGVGAIISVQSDGSAPAFDQFIDSADGQGFPRFS